MYHKHRLTQFIMDCISDQKSTAKGTTACEHIVMCLLFVATVRMLFIAAM